jgi:hypothetical protein
MSYFCYSRSAADRKCFVRGRKESSIIYRLSVNQYTSNCAVKPKNISTAPMGGTSKKSPAPTIKSIKLPAMIPVDRRMPAFIGSQYTTAKPICLRQLFMRHKLHTACPHEKRFFDTSRKWHTSAGSARE